MNISKMLATATVAAVLGTAGVSIAGAASTEARPPEAGVAATDRAAKHPRLAHRIARNGVRLAAETIGITPKELRTEVGAGATIGEVATAHGVEPQAVVDALVDAATAKIEAAQAAGKISDERAAKLLERLPHAAERFVTEWHPKARGACADSTP